MLTTWQRRLAAITTLAVAATRLWARARTQWDWDEVLFSLGLRSFDVTQHHPHPPGFPLYIVLGKFLRLFVHSDFHALQAINVVAAIALFPLLLWLALELRFPFRTAYLGSLLFVFLPNVWFFGGTAFSDIPGLALTLAACAALVRGCRSRRSYFIGALLLGLAAAIRPQALIIGCAPALYASWCRKSMKDLVAASAIGIAVLGAAYGGAVLASDSVAGYVSILRSHRQYIREVDSFLNPRRIPMTSLFRPFFLRAIPGGDITIALAVLTLISIVSSFFRRASGVWLLAAMFLPFNIAGWFMLDPFSISRYSTSYAPMYALLAVDGIGALVFIARFQAPVQSVVVIAAVARFVSWTVPAIREVRKLTSPPVAAVQWIRGNVPKSRPIYVNGSMGPYATYFLSDYAQVPTDDPPSAPDWYVTEGATDCVEGHNFVWDRGHLFGMARHRYFETSVVPLSSRARFVAGWYDPEGVGESVWRWMGSHSETLLPPLPGAARLSLTFNLPTELVPRHPAIGIAINGQLVDHFVPATASVTKQWIAPARGNAWNSLVITIDKVLNPAKEGILPDARDLGLELTSYGWEVSQFSTRPDSSPRLNQ